MKQDITLDIPLQRQPRAVLPPTDMASIRYLFHEMDQQVISQEPASYYFTVKRIMDVTISAIFILISSAFILYEVGNIVNGGETNYVMATLSLFISIYNIFSNLLSILMSFGGND